MCFFCNDLFPQMNGRLFVKTAHLSIRCGHFAVLGPINVSTSLSQEEKTLHSCAAAAQESSGDLQRNLITPLGIFQCPEIMHAFDLLLVNRRSKRSAIRAQDSLSEASVWLEEVAPDASIKSLGVFPASSVNYKYGTCACPQSGE